MPSYCIEVSYIDDEGDSAIDDVLVEADNEEEAVERLKADLVEYVHDADIDYADDVIINSVRER